MSRSRRKHRRERKRRHERQIKEGLRIPTPKIKSKKTLYGVHRYRKIKLSEIDRNIVKAVIDAVRNIDSI